MEYDPDIIFIAVIKDDEVIAVFDADKMAFFKDGYASAGGDTDDLQFREVQKIVVT